MTIHKRTPQKSDRSLEIRRQPEKSKRKMTGKGYKRRHKGKSLLKKS